MDDLTPTMLNGLRRMHKDIVKRNGRPVLASPNDNTARALVRRGLLQESGASGGWQRYILTEAGRRSLASYDPTPPVQP
jgi:hypothetical protein